MHITFTKLSDESHAVHIRRADGSQDRAVLNSRSFLRHDFAHLAVELELPIHAGFWGSVAAGARLAAKDFAGTDIALAESLAAPVQTLMRTEAGPERYLALLRKLRPALATEDLARRIHERARRLTGHWKATPYGGAMHVAWHVD